MCKTKLDKDLVTALATDITTMSAFTEGARAIVDTMPYESEGLAHFFDGTAAAWCRMRGRVETLAQSATVPRHNDLRALETDCRIFRALVAFGAHLAEDHAARSFTLRGFVELGGAMCERLTTATHNLRDGFKAPVPETVEEVAA